MRFSTWRFGHLGVRERPSHVCNSLATASAATTDRLCLATHRSLLHECERENGSTLTKVSVANPHQPHAFVSPSTPPLVFVARPLRCRSTYAGHFAKDTLRLGSHTPSPHGYSCRVCPQAKVEGGQAGHSSVPQAMHQSCWHVRETEARGQRVQSRCHHGDFRVSVAEEAGQISCVLESTRGSGFVTAFFSRRGPFRKGSASRDPRFGLELFGAASASNHLRPTNDQSLIDTNANVAIQLVIISNISSSGGVGGQVSRGRRDAPGMAACESGQSASLPARFSCSYTATPLAARPITATVQ